MSHLEPLAISLPVPSGETPARLPTVTVVVPVYNSEKTLAVLAERLERVLDGLTGGFEVVMVNDGSRDGSWRLINELGARYPWLRGITLTRNYGQHNALLCGVRAARGEVTVTIDDDLQNPPEEIPRLLAELAAGADAVYGTPRRERHGLWRDVASLLTKLVLQNTMGAETAGKVSAFRAFRTQLRDAFAGYSGPFVSIDVLLTWATSAFVAVPVNHEPRAHGSSNYTVAMLITHALNMMTGFTTLPLQLASVTGFAFTLLGVGVLAYVLVKYLLHGGVVPGFTFMASLTSLLGGAQLFALGIIGEYLARVHLRTMDRPSYVIRTTTEPAALPGGAGPPTA